MKKINFEKIPFLNELRTLSDYLTPVAVILLHLYASIVLLLYGNYTIPFLIKAELVCLAVLFVMQIHRMNKIWLWGVLLANVIFVPLSTSRNPSGRLVIIYVGVLLALLVFKQIVVSRTVFLTAHLIPALTLTYFLAMGGDSHMYLDYYEVLGYQINPNLFGILGLACMMHWVCYFDMLRVKVGYRLLGQALGVILGMYYIQHSECRSALIGAAVFVLLLLFRWKPFSNRVCQIVTIPVLAFMLWFPGAYVKLAETSEGGAVLGKLLFTGRQEIWATMIPIIKENLLFGVGTSQEVNMHHTLLELVLCLGIVPLISFLLLCGRPDRRSGDYTVSRGAQMAFLGCLFVGIFETIFIIQYLYIFFLSFLLSAVEKETAGDGS